MQSRQMNILLVEDNDIDVALLKRGLKALGVDHSVMRVHDGMEALDLLRANAERACLPHPFFVLLDINMPRMNGLELLAELRASEELRATRVVMFTTSDNPEDVKRAYDACATGYIVKPDSKPELIAALSTLHRFWEACEHPPRPAA